MTHLSYMEIIFLRSQKGCTSSAYLVLEEVSYELAALLSI